MSQGTLIDYRLRVRGIPMNWRTEILAWEPPVRFVDDQVRGPYQRWRHEHRFTETATGTLCEDRVEYSVLGGRSIHRLLVRRDIEKIFEFSAARIAELFGASLETV